MKLLKHYGTQDSKTLLRSTEIFDFSLKTSKPMLKGGSKTYEMWVNDPITAGRLEEIA